MAEQVFPQTSLERARNAALKWKEQELAKELQRLQRKERRRFSELEVFLLLGAPGRARMQGTMNHNRGAQIGTSSSPLMPIPWKLRIDWDAQKGPHYNVEVGKPARKAAFLFPAPVHKNGQPYSNREASAWVRRIQARWSRS